MSRTSDVYLNSRYGNGASQSSVYNFELLYTPINTVGGNPESPKLSFPYSHDRGHPDLEDLGDDAEAYRWNFQLRGGRAADNYEPLVDFAQALSLNGQALEDAVAEVIDVDQWMRTVAMMSINGNDDVYTRLHMHNFRMFLRPEDQKIVAIPWDLDRAFQLSTTAHPWTQTDSNGDDNNLRKVVERPVNNRLFWGHVLDIANTTANSTYLQNWASNYSSLTGSSYAGRVSYVDSRVAFLLGQLPTAVDFEVTTNGGNDITTGQSFVTLEGTGWVDVREVRLAGSQDALPIEWLDDQRWQVVLPLAFGDNSIELEAFNHQGHPVGTDSLQVTTSASNPLVGALAVTEVMYHPVDPESGPFESADMEFLEFINVSEIPIQLDGIEIVEGAEFTFGNWLLQPDEFVLVVSNQSAFESLYGVGLPIAGEFVSGKLSNSGEELHVEDSVGTSLVRFSYSDSSSWPGRADGKGSSLEVANGGDLNDGDTWRSSSEYSGSPGVAGLGPINDIVVNEVLTHTDVPLSDSIELYNTTDSPINIGGWYVSDSCNDYRKYRIPDNTILDRDSYLILTEADFNPTLGASITDFALSGAHGDEVWLLSAEADGTLTRFMDHVEFGAAANGEAIGRWPNGTGRLTPMQSRTFGDFNSGPRVGPVVISEVMYNPLDPDGVGGVDSLDLEFVEILNDSGGAIDLTNWLVADGVDFGFANGLMLGDGEFLVVAGFDPADTVLLDQFRTYYGIDASVNIVGPFVGNLNNGGERIQLFRPDMPPIDEPNFIPLLLEDEVEYAAATPWPADADTGIYSLTRQQNLEWGNDPNNWLALPPTPGSDFAGPPQVFSFELNVGEVDPPDLPKGSQPTSWQQQRSTINSIELRLTDIVDFSLDDFVLTNLGVNAPTDADVVIDTNTLQMSHDRNVIRFDIANHSLPDGVYQIEVLPTLLSAAGLPIDGDSNGTDGDAYVVDGDNVNRFYVLGAEWSGDFGVSVFDFTTFSYWFGSSTTVAPVYVDANSDDGVSVFDFTTFSENFGIGIVFPVAFASRNVQHGIAGVGDDDAAGEAIDDWDLALMEVLIDWTE
jgi:hypothetical protein